ncbi:MAG: hypothetical protein M3Y72_27290 [Acidobacteriota bacterium]|nr:hypothetical protein [Acidobacteriota bacterium]
MRSTLHQIANEALDVNAHYRFYCYTKPEIALGPDSGWANDTLATVCSSFIWRGAQRAGVNWKARTTLKR